MGDGPTHAPSWSVAAGTERATPNEPGEWARDRPPHGWPVIAVCGGSDSLWPSCPYSAAIVRRPNGAHDPHRHEVLEYPRAGHWIDLLVPYLPVNPDLFLYGLSPVDDDAARGDAWPRVVADIVDGP